MFKKMTVRKQIVLGFMGILIILAVIDIIGYTGIDGIVKHAVSTITGTEIKDEMGQMEVDHLNWKASLVQYINAPEARKLKIQTDYKKCGLGKWLYGEGRRKAEAAIPALAVLFRSME